MSPTEKIIDKLRKMQAMAEGAAAIGNEAEAQAFAEAFQSMLNRHKLSMTDIEFSNLEAEEPVGNHLIDWSKYPDFEAKRSAIQWENILGRIVAQAQHCDIIRYIGTNRFYIVGRASDAAIAEYTIITLIRAANAISRREYGIYYRKCQADGNVKKARGYKDAFLLGFINRLKERYDAARNGDGTSMALVRINREKKAVDDYMAAQREAGETKALKTRKQWAMNEAGRRRGREVADSVDINGKAVKAGDRQERLA